MRQKTNDCQRLFNSEFFKNFYRYVRNKLSLKTREVYQTIRAHATLTNFWTRLKLKPELWPLGDDNTGATAFLKQKLEI
jgi:hypothetical protein